MLDTLLARFAIRAMVPFVLTAAVAACTADEAGEEATAEMPDTASFTADTSAGVGSASEERAPTTVTGELYEWTIILSQDTVPAGEVTFRAINVGEAVHALKVEGEGVEEDSRRIRPGSNAVFTVFLPPGSYEVYCPVSFNDVEHSERGMTATLHVR